MSTPPKHEEAAYPEDAARAGSSAIEEMEKLIASDPAQRLGGESAQGAVAGEEAATLGRTGQVGSETKLKFEESGGDWNRALARDLGREYVSLTDYPIRDAKILRQIPLEICKQYKCFPLREEGEGLLVAISDPLNVHIEDDLKFRLERDVRTVIAEEEAIIDAIDRYYGIGELTLESVIADDAETSDDEGLLEVDLTEHTLSSLDDMANRPAVIRIVDLILTQAIQDKASDLHIEPFDGFMRIRYRVDGVLREINAPPQSLQVGVISRFKVMGSLDIAETRRPQDGRIKISMPDGREVNLRVSSLPTVHGEALVMRILDRSMMEIGISQIGMSKDVLTRFIKACERPDGITLVTGPTGCGKTTTLYAALNEIKNPETKFITTEEPVEYDMDGVVQININEKVGLTFAACLRSILRQDPDKILVGEIRDFETAKIAIEASLTGHMVLSTLHTNSAAATVTRLIDMGIEPFLITSTLQAVIGQRLVRTICPSCKTIYEPTDDELAEFGHARDEIEDINFYHGARCQDCNEMGTKGRMGIFELLEITPVIRELILQNGSTDDIQQESLKTGLTTMRQDGWVKICMGYTTLGEVISHAPADRGRSQDSAASSAPADTPAAASSAPALSPEDLTSSPHIAPGEAAAKPAGPAPIDFGDEADHLGSSPSS